MVSVGGGASLEQSDFSTSKILLYRFPNTSSYISLILRHIDNDAVFTLNSD